MDAKTPLINSDEILSREHVDEEGNTFPRMRNHIRRFGCSFFKWSLIVVAIAGILLGVSFVFPNGFNCESGDDDYYDPNYVCSTGQTAQLALFITSMTLFGIWLLVILGVWCSVSCQASSFDAKISEMSSQPLMHWLTDREHWAKFVEAEYGPGGRQRAASLNWAAVLIGIVIGTAICVWRLYWVMVQTWMVFVICFGSNVVLWVSIRFIVMAILTYRYRHMKNNIEKYHIVLGRDAYYFGRLYWWRLKGETNGCGGQMKLSASRVVQFTDGYCAEFVYLTGGRRPRRVTVRFPVPNELLEPVKNWLRTQVLNGSTFVAAPAAAAGRTVRVRGARSSRSNPRNNRKAKRIPVVVNQATLLSPPVASAEPLSSAIQNGPRLEPSAPSPEPVYSQLSGGQAPEDEDEDDEGEDGENGQQEGSRDIESGHVLASG